MKAPAVIYSDENDQYTIQNGRLVQTSGLYTDRSLNLASLGRILRSYNGTKTPTKTTKYGTFQAAKNIVISPKNYFGYHVPVRTNGANFLSVGSVKFSYAQAQKLRRAALKHSKVLA